jgi:hypothetical protein
MHEQGLEPTARPQYTPDGEKYFAAPPFLPHNTAQARTSSGEVPALPFHWIEVGNMLLDAASDDLMDPDQIRRLLKDLREVRMAKMRSGVDVLDAAATGGGGVALTGVGAMELGEERGFLTGVVDNLRYDIHSYISSRLFILTGHIAKSVHQKSKLGGNKWPSAQMAVTTGPKMKKRITWSFKRCMEGFMFVDLRFLFGV